MKKIFLFLLITAAALVLGFVFSKRTSISKKDASPTPTTQKAPALAITGVSEQQPSYIIGTPEPFSSTVPVYRVEKSLSTEAVISLLTTKLQFSSSPKTIEGSKGTYFLWNEAGKTLTVGGSPLEVSYTNNTLSSKNLRDGVTYSVSATAFLSNFSDLFPSLQPTLSSELYLAPQGGDPKVVLSKSDATVYLANYSFGLGGFPLLLSQATLESASVGLDADGNILSFQFSVLPAFIKTGASYSLISSGDAASLLLQNNGALVRFAYEKGASGKENVIIQPDTPPSSSSISDMQLGYYFDSSTLTLLPAFFFLGTGVDTNGNTLSTLSVVPAGK